MSELNTFSKVKILTFRQKKFCQEYVKKDDHIEAVLASYNTTNRESASAMGRHLLEQSAIRQYIQSIRFDIQAGMENLPAWCAKKLMEAVDIGLKKQQPASVAACVDVLNKMYGYGRRVHSFDLSECETLAEKEQKINHYYANGQLNSFEYQILMTCAVKSDTAKVISDMQDKIQALEARAIKITKAPGRCEKAHDRKNPIAV